MSRSSTRTTTNKLPGISNPVSKHHHHHHHHRNATEEQNPNVLDTSGLQNVFKKPIVGDLFGSIQLQNESEKSFDGLMYRSRVPFHKSIGNTKIAKTEEDVKESVIESVASLADVIDEDADSEGDEHQFQHMNPKQQLALTMRNWTASEDNDEHIVKDGGIQALIALCYVEDPAVRKCCATSFYYLSSREKNRAELLAAGATNGVVLCLHGSPPRCAWKVAKFCALSLCNLSMQCKGETIMANENAIGALVQLSTYRGPALLAICIQALYNMTCTDEHFKGIERIMKAFLTMASTLQDQSNLLIRAFVNVARYSWLRLRIVEDGALACMHSIVATLNTMENLATKKTLVYDILTAIRSLSDSSGCRADMIAKGCIDILYQLLTYCDDRCRQLVIKTVHNFLTTSLMNMLNSMFETTCSIINMIVMATDDYITQQYCAACYHFLTKEELRGMKGLAPGIIDSMGVLLKSDNPLTQYFAISSSGNLFFKHLCDDKVKLEQLLLVFIKYGTSITDSSANQALSLALAKLSLEQSYMVIIEKLGITRNVLELLMRLLEINKDSLVLQESCCIAICRISLRIEGMTIPEKEQIANVFIKMLETDDKYVLGSTISGICALGSSGLCPKQLLSSSLLNRIASIIAKYNNIVELCRTGCAVLAVFSYDIEAHEMLAAANIMKVLFSKIDAEDGTTRELVATCLCNISVNTIASNIMIKMDVVEVLATLSSSTSEVILELCSKCICNLTCTIALHPKMIENKILEIILMIALVRTVSNSTKLICAKALLNLITNENLPAIQSSGSVRVFASLSIIPNIPIQRICSKGFYLLTLNLQRRLTLTSSVPALQAMYNMVKCTSSRTRIRIGTAVCNLLSCHETNKVAISAGALNIIKIIATMDFEELREATARMVINLAHDYSLQQVMFKQPIVEILVLILQQSSNYTFECALMAISCLSQIERFKSLLTEKGGIGALIGTIITGKVCTPLLAEEVCRCLCHMSYNIATAENMVANRQLVLSMQAIYLGGLCSADAALLIALTLRNVSESQTARRFIIEQGAFELLVSMITDFTYSRYCCTIMYSAVVTCIYNLCIVHELHENLIQEGVMRLLKRICLYSDSAEDHLIEKHISAEDTVINFEKKSTRSSGNSMYSKAIDQCTPPITINIPTKNNPITASTTNDPSTPNTPGNPGRKSFLFQKGNKKSVVQQQIATTTQELLNFTHNEVSYISKTINLLSQTPSCHLKIVEGGVMQIIKGLIDGLSILARAEVSTAIANLAASKSCRVALIQEHAVELLISLSSTNDTETQAQCSLALGYLSEISKVKEGFVASSLLLSINLEDNLNIKTLNDNSIYNNKDNTEGNSSIDAKNSIADLSIKSSSMNGNNNMIDPQVKTLSSLIKETIVDKTKSDSYFNSLKINTRKSLDANYFNTSNNNTDDDHDGGGGNGLTGNSSSPSSIPQIILGNTIATTTMNNMYVNSKGVAYYRKATKLYIHDSHAEQLLEEEKAVLKCDYRHYSLDSSDSNDCYESESGGMSVNVLMQLPLPGIPANRDLEPGNKHAELVKLLISTKPLEKDVKIPYHVDSRLVAIESSEEMDEKKKKKSDDDEDEDDDSLITTEDNSLAYNLMSTLERKEYDERKGMNNNNHTPKSNHLLKTVKNVQFIKENLSGKKNISKNKMIAGNDKNNMNTSGNNLNNQQNNLTSGSSKNKSPHRK